jgi:hypothetical protein
LKFFLSLAKEINRAYEYKVKKSKLKNILLKSNIAKRASFGIFIEKISLTNKG